MATPATISEDWFILARMVSGSLEQIYFSPGREVSLSEAEAYFHSLYPDAHILLTHAL